MNKSQTIELLEQQLPGFYSVEQVINIINGIEEDELLSVTSTIISDLVDVVIENVKSDIENCDSSELVDFDSAKFTMDYHNTVELEEIDSDINELCRTLKSTIESTIQYYFDNLNKTEEVE